MGRRALWFTGSQSAALHDAITQYVENSREVEEELTDQGRNLLRAAEEIMAALDFEAARSADSNLIPEERIARVLGSESYWLQKVAIPFSDPPIMVERRTLTADELRALRAIETAGRAGFSEVP